MAVTKHHCDCAFHKHKAVVNMRVRSPKSSGGKGGTLVPPTYTLLHSLRRIMANDAIGHIAGRPRDGQAECFVFTGWFDRNDSVPEKI